MNQWWDNDGDAEPPRPAAVPQQAPSPTAARDTPTIESMAPPSSYQSTDAQTSEPSLIARSGANAMVTGALAGVIAGVVGVGVGSFLSESNDTAPGIVVGFVAATLGFLLNGWGGLSAGYVERGLRDGLIGAVVATGAGLVGLLVADYLFFELRDGPGDVDAERIALIIGWLAIGTLIGAGIGVLQGAQKGLSGLLGGAAGGLLGGLLFVLLDGSREVDGAMLVGALVAASILGIAVGGVERLRRQAWVTVIDGPLAGREFILYGEQNVVGSAGSSRIAIPGDSLVHPHHLIIQVSESSMSAQSAPGAPVRVDGQDFQAGPLRDGAMVQVGTTFFEVHNK